MTQALHQPARSTWSREHAQDLADLVRDLHRSGEHQLAHLAEQALNTTTQSGRS